MLICFSVAHFVGSFFFPPRLALSLRRSEGRNPWVFIRPDHKGPRRKLWVALVDLEPSKTDEIIGSRCFFFPIQVGKNNQEPTTSLLEHLRGAK